jgi:hypothetical protein
MNRVVPELVKKKTARNEEIKKKAVEARTKRREERKTKLKEWIARGAKHYKEGKQSEKALLTLKRQVEGKEMGVGETLGCVLRASGSQGGLCNSDQGHQHSPPAHEEGADSVASETAAQRGFREAQQSHHPNAPSGRALGHLWVPEQGEHLQADLQARLHQGERRPHPHSVQ